MGSHYLRPNRLATAPLHEFDNHEVIIAHDQVMTEFDFSGLRQQVSSPDNCTRPKELQPKLLATSPVDFNTFCRKLSHTKHSTYQEHVLQPQSSSYKQSHMYQVFLDKSGLATRLQQEHSTKAIEPYDHKFSQNQNQTLCTNAQQLLCATTPCQTRDKSQGVYPQAQFAHLQGGGAADDIDPELQQALQLSSIEHSAKKFQKALTHQHIQNLLPDGCQIKTMPADGNCLFHSLSETLFKLKGVPISHDVIRAECAHAIHSVEHLRNNFALETDLWNFVTELAKDGVYGDELSIRAFCNVYQIKVVVHTPTQTIPFGTIGPSVRIAFDNCGHYDAIVPAEHEPANPSHPHSLPLMPGAVKRCPTSKGPLKKNQSKENENRFKKPHNIRLLSINVTSWFPHAADLISSGADILCVQETRLTANGQRVAANQQSDWQVSFGEPMQPAANKNGQTARSATGRGTHGGVAIWTKQPLCSIPVGRDAFDATVFAIPPDFAQRPLPWEIIDFYM